MKHPLQSEGREPARDREDAAIRFVEQRASRFKLMFAVPTLLVALTAGSFAVVRVGFESGGEWGIAFAFLLPFVATLGLALALLRAVWPRRLAVWIVDASARYGVSKRALIQLARVALLPLPSIRLFDWAKAAWEAIRPKP